MMTTLSGRSTSLVPAFLTPFDHLPKCASPAAPPQLQIDGEKEIAAIYSSQSAISDYV